MLKNQFADINGKLYTLTLNLFKVKQVLSATGVDMNTLDTGKLLTQLSDADLMTRVLFVLCDADNLEEFEKAMSGATLEDASEVFMEVYTNFCPARTRAILQRIHGKVKRVNEIMQARIDNLLTNTLEESGNLSMNSQAE